MWGVIVVHCILFSVCAVVHQTKCEINQEDCRQIIPQKMFKVVQLKEENPFEVVGRI